MPYGINILENAMVHSRDLPIYAEAMAERQKERAALLEELMSCTHKALGMVRF